MENFIPPANSASLGVIWKQTTKMSDFEAKWVTTGQQEQFWHPQIFSEMLFWVDMGSYPNV